MAYTEQASIANAADVIDRDLGRTRRQHVPVHVEQGRFQSGAFSRPHSNSAPFADSDALARELLSAPKTMSGWELAGTIAENHRSIA